MRSLDRGEGDFEYGSIFLSEEEEGEREEAGIWLLFELAAAFASSSFFFLRARAIMRQVRFSIRWAWGSETFVRVYSFQTWVARGSSFASCSGSISGSGQPFRSGEPERRGVVIAEVIAGERGGFWVEKRSSENISERRVDFESVEGETGEWAREGGRSWGEESGRPLTGKLAA